MRSNLVNLINSTFIYKYDLPNEKLGINRSMFSTQDDQCYDITGKDEVAEVIYNSIIDYSFNEFDIDAKDYNSLHSVALKTKIKYNEKATEKSKISYGFHGETILYCILCIMFKAKPIISRGYFYNPLAGSETFGYDSYHLIEHDEKVELWFGEVKFRATHSSGIKSALETIEKAISDDYLEKNLFAMVSHKNNFNIVDSKVEEVINDWEKNPELNIIEELKQHNMKLVYPIVILYEGSKKSYDDSVKNAMNYIESNFTSKEFSISIDYSVYFIFIPLTGVREIKSSVIQWIETKKPLIS